MHHKCFLLKYELQHMKYKQGHIKIQYLNNIYLYHIRIDRILSPICLCILEDHLTTNIEAYNYAVFKRSVNIIGSMFYINFVIVLTLYLILFKKKSSFFNLKFQNSFPMLPEGVFGKHTHSQQQTQYNNLKYLIQDSRFLYIS